MTNNSRNYRTHRQPQTVALPVSDALAGNQWVDPRTNPEQANAAIAKILDESAVSPAPEIKFPDADIVVLPGGLAGKDGITRTVEVKELTGEDEESLAKASQSYNPFTFLDRLLRCGVSRIGDSSDQKLLGKLLIGDREAIILGIRRATYGDDINIPEWKCPDCGNEANLSFTLDDIPSVKLNDPSEAEFTVKLRKGGSAKVRLANGDDQLAALEDLELTQAQIDTIFLSRCVISVTDVHGKELPMAAFPSMARTMSMPDRHAILKELGARQPGPRYNEVKFTCANCSKEQNVSVTIGVLFLDFGWL